MENQGTSPTGLFHSFTDIRTNQGPDTQIMTDRWQWQHSWSWCSVKLSPLAMGNFPGM